MRITSAETFAARWLAPRLATFGRQHPGLSIELATGPNIFDLGRREADVAVRTFRSKHEDLVVVRAAEMAFSLYATEAYLARCRTPTGLDDLRAHELLSVDPKPQAVEAVWIHRVARGARFVFSSNLTMAVLNAALTGAGIAVLPCYIGDAEPTLRRLPMPDEPREGIWITVHRDLKHTRRVRALLDFLSARLKKDRGLLLGA